MSGVVWVGPAYDRGGYGAVTRNYVLGLARIGFPVRLVPIGPEHAEVDPRVERLLRSLEGTDVGGTPALVMHSTPEIFTWARFATGFVCRIGCTIFETDRIPEHWVEPCNLMDEVWVPSEFNVATFGRSGVHPGKLQVIPYGIDMRAFERAPEPTVEAPRRGGRPFTFLHVCAFGWRKGLDLLLESFLNEFAPGEAQLVMRVHSEGYQGVAGEEVERVLYESVAERLQRPDGERAEVQILTQALSATDLKRLYECADLYISTDRANGWGVPCQEAMALGIPAATIDWSGSTAFMTAANSVLIHPEDELEPVDERLSQALPQLYGGHRWARVESSEVRRAMRWALEHPDELARIARAGQRHVTDTLDVEHVARRVTDRLSAIAPSPSACALGGVRAYLPWVHGVRARHRLERVLTRR